MVTETWLTDGPSLEEDVQDLVLGTGLKMLYKTEVLMKEDSHPKADLYQSEVVGAMERIFPLVTVKRSPLTLRGITGRSGRELHRKGGYTGERDDLLSGGA